MDNVKLEAKQLFDSISDDQLISLLQESGIEVSRGNRGVIFTDGCDVIQDYSLTGD